MQDVLNFIIVLGFFSMFPLYFLYFWKLKVFIGLLKTKRKTEWERLGSPGFINKSPSSSVYLLRFIWQKQYEQQEDCEIVKQGKQCRRLLIFCFSVFFFVFSLFFIRTL